MEVEQEKNLLQLVKNLVENDRLQGVLIKELQQRVGRLEAAQLTYAVSQPIYSASAR